MLNHASVHNSSQAPRDPGTPAPLRWLHLSDFHVGKDDYGQRRLFKYLLDHVRERIERGMGPDMVFITGDIANKGQPNQYEDFFDDFFDPLGSLLSPECQERIFIVPGNHDVDRAQARAVETYDILLRIREFLDPTDQGQFERSTVFPRFQAYADYDFTNSGDHWFFSPEGALISSLEIRGHKIGVLGLNTAWLSCSDGDRHQLSLGKGILEVGLEALQDCELKIVLGHHPIDWFLDAELAPVRATLGRHNALYLHGHMHKEHSRYEEGAGYSFLALQSGACFQARESDIWVNRLLWCELDLATRQIRVEPLQWSRDHQEWGLDGTAFPEQYREPGTDRWTLPLPEPRAQERLTDAETAASEIGRLVPPAGWVWIDPQYLAKRRNDLTTEQALSYFDGRAPIWREALAPQIPRRDIVHEFVAELEAARLAGGLRVTLLTGAAGEGKSTTLMQTVSDLVETDPDWHVLWHHDPSTPLPAEFLTWLPKPTGTWLIVSDEAELIAQRVFDAVKAMHADRRQNVQFLLSCRDTDWINEKADQLPWRQYTTFVEKWLRGLSLDDARKIVAAWSAYGKEGLRELDGLDRDEAARRLAEAAKSEESSHEGAFLGAMLRVRWGEKLKEHIYNLLQKLKHRPILDGPLTLMDALAYIAAPHAESILSLSKVVLAEALGCTPRELRRKVLRPLGAEAAIATTGQFVFTRHRMIAEAAMEILSDTFYVDVDEIYVDLVQAAHRVFETGNYVPRFGDWQYLSSHFFDKGNQTLGIRLAQAALEMQPQSPYLIVKLSQLLRETGQPEQAVQVFLEAPSDVKKLRGYYFEWGTSEGNVGSHALNVWLAGLSLADQAERKPTDNKNSIISLNGLSVAFAELFDSYNAPIFAEACGGTAQLGLTLRLDPTTESFLRCSQARARAAGVEDVDPPVALERVQAGILAAWKQREDELPEWIPPADTLTFDGLARLLRIESDRESRRKSNEKYDN